MFHVFRRHPDGYVHAINGDADSLKGNHGVRNGIPVWFEVLLSTDDWGEAWGRICDERGEPRPEWL